MKQLLFIFLILLPLVTSGTACRNNTANRPATLEYTDALGRSVQIPVNPARIISLAPSVTETIFAAGASDLLVAVSAVDNFPPEVDSLPGITVYPSVDYEQIIAARPDIVFASTDVQGPDIADRLTDLDISVFYLDGSSLSGIFDNVRTVGDITKRSEKASMQADLLVSSVEQMKSLTTSDTRPPRVLVLVGDQELYSFGSGSYINEMVRAAGGISISEDVSMEAPVLSDEFVLNEQPDIILLALGAEYDSSSLLKNHPSWDILPAVENDQIYSLDPDLLLRPGPRVVDGILRLATIISPESFINSTGSTSD